ncbi:uncharacterized protein F5Z01DRAFT_662267 [Emericellopsis atlantica]|uniref:Postreplication repair E3 ubiquitin-protein ligase RAD18 n=1 Tax=Emericellopsis atlantica TaxID=2614577 RepID=A0A9P7ZGT1_9HYPO|nr:uncharacterized protein F5Z01DRAFT_662267 [Emericellopsis atlantica]KAG9251839.1 hypothetical protein F5Z01DRAFT_662267 [Emericellopsis atlantica]
MVEHDVTDSTDWLSTPLSALTPLESALRCQVCKDFYTTPMLTSCSHTFCSLCIRRALASDMKCPLCRANDQEMKLRSNWSMEEAVEAWKGARSRTLEMARSRGAPGSPKRKANEVELEEQTGSKRLRSSARLSGKATMPSYAPKPIGGDDIVQISDGEEEFEPEPDDGLVSCPSCRKRMKEWQVFTHLNTCTGPSPKPKTPPKPQLGAFGQPQQKAKDRLPAVNYSMLKDNALRKRLADLGLSTQGPRTILESRHREFLTLWNANCDAVYPKRKAQLISDLESWERAQRTGGANRGTMVKDKEFDGVAWAQKHGDSFKDLVAEALRNRAVAKSKSIPEDGGPAAEHEPRKPAEESLPFPSNPAAVVPITAGDGVAMLSRPANEQEDQAIHVAVRVTESSSDIPLAGRTYHAQNASHGEPRPRQDCDNVVPAQFDPGAHGTGFLRD